MPVSTLQAHKSFIPYTKIQHAILNYFQVAYSGYAFIWDIVRDYFNKNTHLNVYVTTVQVCRQLTTKTPKKLT